MRILALDISKNRTGYCFGEDDVLGAYGAIECPKNLAKIKQDTPEFANLLFWYFKEIRLLAKNIQPDVIVIERLNLEHNRAAKTIIQFHTTAILSTKIPIRNIVLGYVHNMTAKAHMGVNVKARDIGPDILAKMKEHKINRHVKIMMVDAVNKKYGLKLTYKQDDEADSIALWDTYYSKEICCE